MAELVEEIVVPRVEEVLRLRKRRVETGRVRVAVTADTEDRVLHETLRGTQAEVERVPVGRVVAEAPEVRREGNTLVIPVVEEELVVTRRLVLREEVRVRLRETEEAAQVAAAVRVGRVAVERLPPDPARAVMQSVSGSEEAEHFMTRTITGLFDSRAEAERAVEALVSRTGLARESVQMHAQEASSSASGTAPGVSAQSQAGESKGFFAGLRDLFLPEEDAHSYSEGVRRGGVLVAARVEDSQAEHAMDVLEEYGAVDLDTREAEWRSQGWSGYAGDAALGASSDGIRTGVSADLSANRMNPAATGTTAVGGDLGTGAAATGAMRATGTVREGESETISLGEERLVVGKRETGRGRVRVRSYMVETPVEEQVHLREEHVDVQRRAVDRPATDADHLFQDRTIEVTESREEAVVGKEARIREEVVIRKEADDRVETVRDTVRRTEVEVDDDTRQDDVRRTETTTTGTVGVAADRTTTGPTRNRT